MNAHRIYIVLLISLVASPPVAEAAWYSRCPQCARHLGGTGVSDPYPTKQKCEAERLHERAQNGFPWEECTGSDDVSSGGSPSGNSGGNADLIMKSTEGILRGISSGDAGLTSMGMLGVTTALFLDSLNSDPAADARRAQAQARAAQEAAEAAQAAEQQRQEVMRQQEMAKQRVLALLKGTGSSTGLAIKTGDSDPTLVVTESTGMFGSPEVTPVRTKSPPVVNELKIKLGDDPDPAGVLANLSMESRQGFDTSGKMMGATLTPPPKSPKPWSISPAEKSKIIDALQGRLKESQAEEKTLKNQLEKLQQAPTPDLVAIDEVKKKIEDKGQLIGAQERILEDLTAKDDRDAAEPNHPAGRSEAISAASAIPEGSQ